MIKSVASLRYTTIFKKAFSQKEIFTAFVRSTTWASQKQL